MLTFIDIIIDRITMYRLVLYYLIVLLVMAGVLSTFHFLPFNPIPLLFTTTLFLIACWIFNALLAGLFKAPTNVESVYITALILSLIVTPVNSPLGIPTIILISLLAMASKYILAINKKHIFNPAAFGVWTVGFFFHHYPSWWVGTGMMVPFVIIGGLLLVKKIQRKVLVGSFFIVAITGFEYFSLIHGTNWVIGLKKVFLETPLFFFAFVMLTEPLTTPPTNFFQAVLGIITGIFFLPYISILGFEGTPEFSLLAGNIFSYIVSPKTKLFLSLKEKIQVSSDIVDFVFIPNERINFLPGQYMEWTFQHLHTDSRGNRRYFTIASSPTEKELRLGIRFYDKGSSFKEALKKINTTTPIIASQIAGEFVLPKDTTKKLVFLAGGIGITPFRSIMKYLLDTKEKRDIVLVYSNKTADEIAYKEVFDEAEKNLRIKTIYTLTDTTYVSKSWKGKVGRINAELIQTEIPDFQERFFYLSGPHTMVTSCENVLRSLGVGASHIKIDFFPGLV